MSTSSATPSLFRRDDVYTDYIPRVQEFMNEGRKAGLRPSVDDNIRTSLILIDLQNDFVRTAAKGAALSVPGAEEDLERLIRFIYAHPEEITTIYATLDTHYAFMIFFAEWWYNQKTGEMPDPYTQILTDDIISGKWQARIEPVWSQKYPFLLKDAGKDPLMIWPKHCLAGTWGHNLVPALTEAIFWHAAARKTQPVFLIKGDIPQVERYGPFANEVFYPGDTRGIVDTAMLDPFAKFDRNFIAGQAKSHCVKVGTQQYVDYFGKQRQLLENTFFLTDCTSSVQHPLVDFEAIANAALQEVAAKGVKLVKSTDSFL